MQKTDKKHILIIVATVTLAGVILGGVVSSIFNSPSGSRQYSGSQSIGQPSQDTQQQANRILALEQKVAANPDNVKNWIELGNEYFDTDDYTKAINAYNKSLELSPNDPNVLTDLGIMHQRIGQPEKAIEMFEKAAAVNPSHEESRFNKGVVLLYDLKDKEGTIAAWEDLLKVNPEAIAPNNGQPISEIITNMKEEK